MEKYVLIKMGNEEKESMQLKIDHVKEEITDLEMKNIVNILEETEIFTGKKGPLNIGVEAKLVEINYREFDL